mmetsp:Transcript_9207/g.28027  ORF Transcript_9207/g.28027 Transcript_9207/m.28027 type:complete len:261 (-) Transcript_9207:1593-2375(-)
MEPHPAPPRLHARTLHRRRRGSQPLVHPPAAPCPLDERWAPFRAAWGAGSWTAGTDSPPRRHRQARGPRRRRRDRAHPFQATSGWCARPRTPQHARSCRTTSPARSTAAGSAGASRQQSSAPPPRRCLRAPAAAARAHLPAAAAAQCGAQRQPCRRPWSWGRPPGTPAPLHPTRPRRRYQSPRWTRAGRRPPRPKPQPLRPAPCSQTAETTAGCARWTAAAGRGSRAPWPPAPARRPLGSGGRSRRCARPADRARAPPRA